MADINITQDEADALIAIEKVRVDQKEWTFPAPGDRVGIPLVSADKRESFLLDVSRSQIKLNQGDISESSEASDHPLASRYRRGSAS